MGACSSTEKTAKNIKLNLKQIAKHKDKNIGEDVTLLALKDRGSYLIATRHKGYKLVDAGMQLLFEDTLPSMQNELWDIAYIGHIDSYLLCMNNKIFRKDIDENPLYLYMEIEVGGPVPGKSFIFSDKNLHLIAVNPKNDFLVLNPKDKSNEQREWRGGGRLQAFWL